MRRSWQRQTSSDLPTGPTRARHAAPPARRPATDTLPALQRLAGNRAVATAVRQLRDGGTAAAVQRVDQRTGTALPDAAQQADIQNELNPAVAAVHGGPAPAWDGASTRGTVPAAAGRARADLIRELTAALNTRLTNAMRGVVAPAKRQPKLPMTSFEGAGRAAKQVVDAEFGAWTSAAALTAPQQHVRNAHQFRASGPGQNLFDATDMRQRAGAGQPLNPTDLANWMAASDNGAQTVQANHHFSPLRSAEENNFLRDQILRPFIAAHRRELLEWDLYGFGMADPLTGRIVAGPQLMAGHSTAAGAGGDSSDAVRATQWEMWKLLIHEYIHTLEHPNTRAASRGNRVILEGFCEMFTQDVLFPALAGAAGNVALVDEVEGRHNSVPPTPAILGVYATPGDYVAYLAHARQIRDHILGGGGPNAVRAAFFQGHVEFLGLSPTGTRAAPAAANSADLVGIPAGVTTMTEFATATGVSAADIVNANPGTGVTATSAGPLPARLHAPGCREHVVVMATDQGGNQAVETKAQIATQNGVATTDLDRANPAMNWPGLAAGDRVLIPFH
ncbi:MAG: hypothetical protein ACJ73S_16160 [Mycobacteriales bacterium]